MMTTTSGLEPHFAFQPRQAVDLRCYEQCAEILGHLGVNRVRLMSHNPEKIRALEAMGLKVFERISLTHSQRMQPEAICALRKKRWAIC